MNIDEYLIYIQEQELYQMMENSKKQVLSVSFEVNTLPTETEGKGPLFVLFTYLSI